MPKKYRNNVSVHQWKSRWRIYKIHIIYIYIPYIICSICHIIYFSYGIFIYIIYVEREYYLAMRKEDILPLVTTWTDFMGIVVGEISQTEKDKSYIISLICGI